MPQTDLLMSVWGLGSLLFSSHGEMPCDVTEVTWFGRALFFFFFSHFLFFFFSQGAFLFLNQSLWLSATASESQHLLVV